MKIIDDCPICKCDFMYDPNFDTYLFRKVENDGDKKNDNEYIVICQDCDEKEKTNKNTKQ